MSEKFMRIWSDESHILTKTSVLEAKSGIDSNTTAMGPEELKGLNKINDASMGYVRNTVIDMKANPQFVSAYSSISDIEKNIKLYDQLYDIEVPILQIATAIHDTKAVLKHQIMELIYDFYNSVQRAAKLDIPGAKDILSNMSPRFEKSKEKEDQGEEEEENTPNQ